MTFRDLLFRRVEQAITRSGYPADTAAIAPATDARFGDYQCNSAMALARHSGEKPRDVAGKILASMDVGDICSPPEIAGAGFLNFRLHKEVIASRLAGFSSDERLGVPRVGHPQTIVIDFSSPNVAKPMHVGHIRSTILGDCLARTARFLGHHVVTDNHLGDWGTQFGKILYGWKHLLDRDALERAPVPELLRLYREVNALEAGNPDIAREVRAELVRLQSGDPENLEIWRRAVDLSWGEFAKLYALLDIDFDEHLGESFYNERLAPLVERLLATGIAEISEGAACVFFRDIPDLTDKPCLVRKTDGGFLYATTDLATLEFRATRWNPDAVWYVAGAPQSLHFQQVFETARKMGIRSTTRHIAFGSILGEDRKIMKTRSGDNVQLSDVLDEAVARARQIVAQKNPNLPDDEATRIARAIGIGAVKYAELSQHRMTDYVFSWDKMLAFQGNTAPYLQNAFVRTCSIFRKIQENAPTTSSPTSTPGIPPFRNFSPSRPPGLETPEERALAMKLLRFGETVPEMLDDFRPNILANYLYDLAICFHAFYEACPVLKSEGSLREERLFLCACTARVLEAGLGLLGIECPQRM